MTEYMQFRKNDTVKKIYITVIGIFAAATVLFAIMWFVAKNDSSSVAQSAVRYAQNTADSLSAYAENGNEQDFTRAVSYYYAFTEQIRLLTEGTTRVHYYTESFNVYQLMVENPDTVRSDAAYLASVMETLSTDIYEMSAYQKLNTFGQNP